MKRERTAFILTIALMLAVGMLACGGGGGGGGGEAAVPTGFEPTVIGNSTFTRAVETDGDWVIWEAREESLLMVDGNRTVDLTANLGAEYTLIDRDRNSGGDNCFSYISFDGRYAAFQADNVLDDEALQVFLVDTNASNPTPVQVSDGDITMAPVVAGGVVAWIDSAEDVVVYDIAAATASTLGVTVAGGQLLASEGYLIFVQSGEGVIAYEVATATASTMTGTDGNETLLTGGYGYAAFVDANNIYYISPGNQPAKATSTAGAPSNIAIGDGFIAYEEGADIWSYVIGAPAGSVFAEEVTNDPATVAAGDGVIAYEYNEDIYYLEQGDDGNGRYRLTSDSTNIDDGRGLKVDGSVIFWVRDMNDLRECDPSSYVATYDTATWSYKVLNGDYMRVFDPESADGKFVFNSRDANWGLFAQRASAALNPVELTPNQFNVSGDPKVVDGILVFNALDRDNVANPGNGDESVEVYYINLNSSSKAMNRVTFNNERERHLQTDGDLIAYNTEESDQVFMYDISAGTTKQLFKGSNTSDAYIGVGDGVVAWNGYSGGWGLYYYDTNAATPEVKKLTGGSYTSNPHPRVAGGTIIWSYSNTLYYHNIGEPLGSFGTIASNTNNPFFDGQTVVWRNYSDYMVWYYDMDDAVATSISGTDVYDYPHVSNGLIVWGEDTDALGDQELYYYDLDAAAPAVTRLTDNVLWDCYSRVSSGVVSFRTGGSDQWDWQGKIAAAARQ